MACRLALISFVLAFAAFGGRAHAAGGDLDPTFGQGGTALYDLGPGNGTAQDIIRQPDGRFVAAGWGMIRVLPDGSLDPSFGSAGFVDSYGYANALALQADGRILTAAIRSGPAVEIARYLSTGGLDPSFGDRGVASNSIGIEGRYYVGKGYDVAVQPDGKIVTVGEAQEYPGFDLQGYDFLAMRLLPNGKRDPDFGSDGSVVTEFFGGRDTARAVAIQPDGRIVVVGEAPDPHVGTTYFGMVRYLPNGALDPSFGDGGKVVTSFGLYLTSAYDVVIDPEGRILVGGAAWNGRATEFAIARYLPNGALDPSFSEDGKAQIQIADHDDVGYRVEELAVDSKGRIVAAGCRLCRYSGEFAVVRMLPDGSLDPAFGGHGSALTYFSDTGSVGGLALDRSDAIVVAGGTNPGRYPVMNLARYQSGDEACLDVDGERAFLSGAARRLVVRGIGDAAPGDEVIEFQGDLILPQGLRFADLNPLATGARSVLLSRTGETLLDVTLPPGTLVSGSGWSSNRASTRWTYQDRDPGALLGKHRLILVASTPDERRVRVRMRTKKATLALAPGAEPLEIVVSLGTEDPATGGACAIAAFEAQQCEWPDRSATRLVCRG